MDKQEMSLMTWKAIALIAIIVALGMIALCVIQSGVSKGKVEELTEQTVLLQEELAACKEELSSANKLKNMYKDLCRQFQEAQSETTNIHEAPLSIDEFLAKYATK